MKYLVKTQMMMEETLWVEADNEDDAKALAHAEAEYIDGYWYDSGIIREEGGENKQ